MLTPEQGEYYRALEDTFATKGWKIIMEDALAQIYQNQCEGPGAMISIWIRGGEEEAFRFIDALQMVHLAVSLGSTESLIQHPSSMTHAGVDPEHKMRHDITDSLVRLSVGVEDPDDIIADLSTALDKV